MGTEDLFTKELWVGVAKDLRGPAKAWWTENKDVIIGYAQDELADIMYSLRQGKTAEAQIALMSHATPEEWKAFRDGVTKDLSDLAKRRYEMFEQLKELGIKAAKLIASLVLGRLGL